MPVTFSSALYYPYIDIRNERWLRRAALFWHSIRTIVPVSHRDPYSSEFARDLNDQGFLAPIRVQSDMEEIKDITDVVMDYITDPASAGVIFATDKSPTRRIHPEKMCREFREWANIHPEKLPHIINSHFERALDGDGWYRVSPGFANFYMTLLASRLSERLGLGLVTESSSADQLAIAVHKGKPLGSTEPELFRQRRMGRHFEAFGPRRSLPTEVVPGLLIDTVVQGIVLPEHLSVQELLKFKLDHKEELALFRREINRLATDMPKEASVEALRQAVADQYDAQVLPAMRSLKQSLRAQKWDAALNGFLKISFFSVASNSAAILAGIPNAFALIAGIGISMTVSAVLFAHQQRRIYTENPYSYLLSLDRQW